MNPTLLVALDAIRTNALRSILTTLGIIIGVAAVIAMVALGEGAERRVQGEIERMGTNVLTVRAGQQFRGAVSRGGGFLSEDDADALKAELGNEYLVAPEAESSYQIEYQRWNSNNSIVGTWPAYMDVYDHQLAHGQWFDEGDVQGRRRVAVLGSNVPAALGTPPGVLVGKTIQIRGIAFEVVGILEEKGGAAWLQPDDQVFIPLSTALYRVMGNPDRIRSIYVAAGSPDELDNAWAAIDQVLRREHRIKLGDEADFSIQNAASMLETLNESSQTFTALLAGIAAVSLLVGGIGIMNIMLVSVTERTREIGVRKAMGARRRTILFQFLVEALVLCTLGGVAGLLAGIGGAELINRLAGWDAVVAPEAAVIAIVFSAAIGLFFGIWPARRAARLDPIDALRYE